MIPTVKRNGERMVIVPERLYATCDWIDSAEEWEDAMSDPSYPHEAAMRYKDYFNDGKVTEESIKEVIKLCGAVYDYSLIGFILKSANKIKDLLARVVS